MKWKIKYDDGFDIESLSVLCKITFHDEEMKIIFLEDKHGNYFLIKNLNHIVRLEKARKFQLI